MKQKYNAEELFQAEIKDAQNKAHRCRTYFAIYGAEDINAICDALSLGKCDLQIENHGIRIGYNENYRTDINEMIRETLAPVIDKTEILSALAKELSLEYYLALVPEIASDSDEPNQMLSIDEDIIEFLYLTKTKLDLDYYVY